MRRRRAWARRSDRTTDRLETAAGGDAMRSGRERLEIVLGQRKPGDVTDRRYFSGKISARCNAWPGCLDCGLGCTCSDPTGCHHCKESFAPGQMRYPVMTGVDFATAGWGIASICMRCFKYASADQCTSLTRVTTTCAGCGEPIRTVTSARKGRWNVCSNRCYQREYRKRRRGRQSVVDWKLESLRPRCEACKQPIKDARRDARFCSNKCRQWHYRRRKRAGAAP
jgi:hypothetical protein